MACFPLLKDYLSIAFSKRGKALNKQGLNHLPSGNLLHSYGKWPFIVEIPIRNCDFSIFSIVMLNYQRVFLSQSTRLDG